MKKKDAGMRVRITQEARDEFGRACRRNGETFASSVVRRLMMDYIQDVDHENVRASREWILCRQVDELRQLITDLNADDSFDVARLTQTAMMNVDQVLTKLQDYGLSEEELKAERRD